MIVTWCGICTIGHNGNEIKADGGDKTATAKRLGLLSKAKALVAIAAVSAEDETTLKKYKFVLKHGMTKEEMHLWLMFYLVVFKQKRRKLAIGVEMKPQIKSNIKIYKYFIGQKLDQKNGKCNLVWYL